ncbi:helix-turn-helix transcriptional regulator [Mycolicibacterium brumae]|nr:helix-turn-helix domain-containing protein [Mycolicibacterium brumae]UWW08322.1 helix-turn-helix transcriptional regulator [Mycolicibacterium brumae]
MIFIRQILDRIGDKWTLLVIAVLANGPRRYTDLHNDIGIISQRMLTLTLRQLRQDGLVTRTSYPEVPPRVEYALTPLSHGLLDIVTSLITWAAANREVILANRARAAAAEQSA